MKPKPCATCKVRPRTKGKSYCKPCRNARERRSIGGSVDSSAFSWRARYRPPRAS